MGRGSKIMFDGHYEDWRSKRIEKIERIFGVQWFRGKTILELGCGYGDIGVHFKNRGAIVTFCDARQEHLDVVKKRHGDVETIVVDQDKPWNLNRKFDVIIHMGVLYHLQNWKQDLACTVNHLKPDGHLILETTVMNNEKDNIEMNIRENGYDKSPYNLAVIPTARYIEKTINDLKLIHIRYDDPKMNSGIHRYDWKVDNKQNEMTRSPRVKDEDGAYIPRRMWNIFV